MKLRRAAPQAVRARFGLDGDHARRRLSEFGVIVLRCDLRLLNGFDVRVDDDDPENRVAVFRSIKLITRAAEVLSVHHRLRRPLRVLAGRMLPLELLRAWREQNEFGEVVIQNRQIGDLFGVERRRHVGAIALEQR